MGKIAKSDSSNMFNLVYREFSRQRYAKYKHQYPKLRESEIVSKIIKEWDSLDKNDKQGLLQSYENDKFINKKEASEPDSPRGSVQKAKIEKTNLDKTAQRSVIVKSDYKQEQSHLNDSQREGLSQHGSSKRSVESRSVPPSAQTRKTIVGRNDYLTFYKYYYDKYQKEHKKWTSQQVSKVISILWQKRKIQFKKVSIKKSQKSDTQNTKVKHTNGKQLFKKKNKLTTEEANKKWSMLPKQSKQLWNSSGIQEEPLGSMSSLMKFGGQYQETKPQTLSKSNPFVFLNKLIG